MGQIAQGTTILGARQFATPLVFRMHMPFTLTPSVLEASLRGPRNVFHHPQTCG